MKTELENKIKELEKEIKFLKEMLRFAFEGFDENTMPKELLEKIKRLRAKE